MRHAPALVLFAVLLGLSSPLAAQTPPPAPTPAQQKADTKVVETVTGAETAEKDTGLKLEWAGKDVSPVCMDKLVMGETQLSNIAIAACLEDKNLKITKTYRKDGWLMTDYRYRDFFEDDPDITTMYRVIGEVKAGTVLEVGNYTGGSGRFTSIVIVKLDGGYLHLIKSLGGGDRCNGGVADTGIENGILSYGFYITPGDFSMTAYGDDHGLVAYEDLEASAASCFAIARYKDEKLDSVEFLPDPVKSPDPEWVGRYKYQKCFNERFSDQLKKNPVLSLPDFKTWVGQFLDVCRK